MYILGLDIPLIELILIILVLLVLLAILFLVWFKRIVNLEKIELLELHRLGVNAGDVDKQIKIIEEKAIAQGKAIEEAARKKASREAQIVAEKEARADAAARASRTREINEIKSNLKSNIKSGYHKFVKAITLVEARKEWANASERRQAARAREERENQIAAQAEARADAARSAARRREIAEIKSNLKSNIKSGYNKFVKVISFAEARKEWAQAAERRHAAKLREARESQLAAAAEARADAARSAARRREINEIKSELKSKTRSIWHKFVKAVSFTEARKDWTQAAERRHAAKVRGERENQIAAQAEARAAAVRSAARRREINEIKSELKSKTRSIWHKFVKAVSFKEQRKDWAAATERRHAAKLREARESQLSVAIEARADAARSAARRREIAEIKSNLKSNIKSGYNKFVKVISFAEARKEWAEAAKRKEAESARTVRKVGKEIAKIESNMKSNTMSGYHKFALGVTEQRKELAKNTAKAASKAKSMWHNFMKAITLVEQRKKWAEAAERRHAARLIEKKEARIFAEIKAKSKEAKKEVLKEEKARRAAIREEKIKNFFRNLFGAKNN